MSYKIYIISTRLIFDMLVILGDDCVSIVNASSNIKMKSLYCGPGHGIRYYWIIYFIPKTDRKLIFQFSEFWGNKMDYSSNALFYVFFLFV